VPAFGPGALAVLALALLLLTLLTTPLRLLGLAAVPAGLALAMQHPRPDLFVDGEGSGGAVRGIDGRLVLLGRAPAFVVEQWLRADGDGRQADDPTLRAGVRCDPVGCVAIGAGGRPIALVLDRRGFEEDCRRAAVVISRLSAPESCKPPHRFDRASLASSGGAVTQRWTEPGPTIETSRRPRDPRPWLQRGPSPPPPLLLTPMGEPATALPSEPTIELREDPRPCPRRRPARRSALLAPGPLPVGTAQ
jgi:competence protein ComEC